MVQYPIGAAAKLLASAYSVQAITLATGIVLARGMTVDERGELALYLATVTLSAGIVAAGTGEYISLHVRSGQRDFTGLLRRLGYLAPQGFIMCALVLLGMATPYVDGARAAPLALYLLCNVGTAVALGMLLGLGEIGWLSIIRVINVALILASFLLLALIDRLSFDTCVWIYAASESATFTLSLRVARRLWRKASFSPSPRSPGGAFVTRAIVYIPSATLAGLFGSLFERILLVYGDFIGGASNAAYLAVGIASIAPVTTAGVALIPLSLLAGVDGLRGLGEVSRRRKLARTGSMLVGAVAYGLALTVLVPLVYGRAFEPAVAVAQSLLAGSIALSIARNLGAKLRGLGRIGSLVRNDAASIMAFGALCLASALLGPWHLAALWTLAGAGSASLHALTLRRVRGAGSAPSPGVATSGDSGK